MKRYLTIAGVLFVAGVLSVSLFSNDSAWGRNRGGGGYWGGPGACWNYDRGPVPGDLSEEQAARLDELYQTHYDETAAVRNELWAKRSQLRTLLGASEVDHAQITALQKEINDLRSTLSEKRTELMLKAREIAPDHRFAGVYGKGRGYGGYGRGFHRGGYGPHMGGGYGPGGKGGYGGYGPGACWR